MLVSISNPSTMAPLVELAIKMQDKAQQWPIYLLNIVHEDMSSRENMSRIKNLLESNIKEFNTLSESVRVITRVDLSVSGGIVRAAKEYMASEILLGWGGMKAASTRLLGSVFDQLYKETQVLYVYHVNQSHEEINAIRLLLPDGIEHEKSVELIMNRISRLGVKPGGNIELYGGNTSESITSMLSGRKRVKIIGKPRDDSFHLSPEDATREILYIMIMPRKHTVSYDPAYNSFVRKQITLLEKGNFMVIVPGYE